LSTLLRLNGLPLIVSKIGSIGISKDRCARSMVRDGSVQVVGIGADVTEIKNAQAGFPSG
jgi:hypothetical protein